MADERKDQASTESTGKAGGAVGALPWAEKWLSAERLTPYLKACDGDAEKALALYEWNSSLAQLLMRDISNFEVALRNACNAAMESSWQGDAHWLLDENSPARRPVMRKSARGMLDSNRINRKAIDAAVDGLSKGFSTGSLVAGLTLGFWVHLSDRSREAVIWRSGLYKACGPRAPTVPSCRRGCTASYACATAWPTTNGSPVRSGLSCRLRKSMPMPSSC